VRAVALGDKPQSTTVRTPTPPVEPVALTGAAPMSVWGSYRHLSAPPRSMHRMNLSPGRPLQLQPGQQLPLASQQHQQPMSTTVRAAVTSRAGPSWAFGGSIASNQPQQTPRAVSAGTAKVPNAVLPMVHRDHSPARTQPPQRPAWQWPTGITLPVPQVSCQQASSRISGCEPVVIPPPSPRSVPEQRQQQRQQQPQQSSSRVATRTSGCDAGLRETGSRTSMRSSTGSCRWRGFSEERKVGASAQIAANGVIRTVGASGDPIDERWGQVCGEVAKLRQELDKVSTACGHYRSNV